MGEIGERQARELAPLLDQPDALRDAWQQANEQTGGGRSLGYCDRGPREQGSSRPRTLMRRDPRAKPHGM